MKIICENHRCRWIGEENELLQAPNPFEEGEVITACPQCKDICSLGSACDEPGCNLVGKCGTPTPDGYRFTCHVHVPQQSAAQPVPTIQQEAAK